MSLPTRPAAPVIERVRAARLEREPLPVIGPVVTPPEASEVEPPASLPRGFLEAEPVPVAATGAPALPVVAAPPRQVSDVGPAVAGVVRGSSGGRSTRRRRKISATDVELLQWLARSRVSTAEIAAIAVGRRYDALRRRLPQLRDHGLVDSVEAGPSSMFVWHVTPDGADVAGTHLDAPPPPGWATLVHDLGVAAIGAVEQAKGGVVMFDREIRAIDQRDRDTAGDRVWAGRGLLEARDLQFAIPMPDGRLHIPDLVFVKPAVGGVGQHIYIELELQRKNPAKLLAISTGYRLAAQTRDDLARVMYLSPQSLTRRAVDKAARLCGANGGRVDLIEIHDWRPHPATGVRSGFGIAATRLTSTRRQAALAPLPQPSK